MEVYTGGQVYRYRVNRTRSVESTDISVISPTSSLVLKLVCGYPSVIDTYRIVVIAEM